jgi:hypothetical protein
MPMDRELIDAKLAELKRFREQLVATLNAHNGAIEVCEQLLKEADGVQGPQEGVESP